ncbi:DUF6584 family protein [Agrococcus jenensis]|uniref:Uncharacterized protein n=1 Tax=Agrococcus jenensis TaxID=46353 RepID=A0A3N2AVN6_9MICO|nr:DUF6584 family protein [Agrococcus jenensis]ROR67087.1 hypothetical protein EDD26_2486 [Agrococcus jenensis]
MDAIARARAHAAYGRTRAAIDLLKPLATGEQPPYAARRALAELYRDLGAPDQAGRWGVVIDGWTSAFERDRLARALIWYHEPRAFLSLAAGAPEPADLPAVLELRGQHGERAEARRRTAAADGKHSPASRAARREEALVAVTAVLVALGAIGPWLALGVVRMLARDPWAAAVMGAGWSLFALGALLMAVHRWMEDRRLGASTWVTLVTAAFAVGSFALAASWTAA